jgi:hypothetical protein
MEGSPGGDLHHILRWFDLYVLNQPTHLYDVR